MRKLLALLRRRKRKPEETPRIKAWSPLSRGAMAVHIAAASNMNISTKKLAALLRGRTR